MMSFFHRAALLAAACSLLPLLAPPLPAQKAQLGSPWFVDKHNGYRVKYPDEWKAVPVQPQEADNGVVAQMDGPDLATRMGNRSYDWTAQLTIMRFEAPEVVTDATGSEDGDLRGRVESGAAQRQTVEQMLQTLAEIYQLRNFKGETAEPFEHKSVKAAHQVFTGFTGDITVAFDTYTYHLPDFDIALVYLIPQEHMAKWQKVFVSSAKTFEPIARTEAVQVTDENDYGQILAAAKDEASRTQGWRVMEVPSKRYIIKTSSTDERFLKTVIDRLEASRDLFERDFPPSAPIQHVSIVRVCSNLEEFSKYGKTGGGVAGWFNPQTTELVIVDFREYNRNMTYAVMTHEGFHQYCHFLFGESEAHRWFDEGHGDYYGGFEFQGRKAICKAKMPPGLERLSGIRAMIREDTYAPISKHIRMDHPSWQSQGPDNVSPYEESWSIIYYLRRGMEGDVSKRLWRPEYANIIPEYMRVLNEEYQKAYEEAREKMRKAAEADGREVKPEDLKDVYIPSDKRDEIWDKALAASWGQVDIDQFEQNWKEYVMKELKD